jgi:hypothetical protein
MRLRCSCSRVGRLAGRDQDRAGVEDAVAVGVDPAVGPADLDDAILPHGALVVDGRGQKAQRAGLVLPGRQTGQARIDALVGQLRIAARRGHGHGRLLEVQRPEGAHVDDAGDAAFVQRGLGALDHLDRRDQLRGEGVEAELAAGGAAVADVLVHRGGAAVQGDDVERGAQAPHADEDAFAAVADDRHARHALQRLGDVLGGELADVLGLDHVDDVGRLALLVQRLGQAVGDAGDDDVFRRPGRVLRSAPKSSPAHR